MTTRQRLALALTAASATPVLAQFLFDRVTALGIWLLVLAPPVSWLAAGLLLQPLAELRETARRLRAGDLQARAVVGAASDWGEVAGTLGTLAAELDEVTRTFEQQVQQRTEALERLADQLRAVGQVGQQVAGVLEPQRLLHFVVRVLRGTFTYDVAAVLRLEGNHLVLAAAAARDRDEVPLGRVFAASGPDAPPLAAARGLGGATDVSPLVAGVEARSELAVPVRVGSRTIGILVVQSTEAGAFDDDDEFTVSTIAGQVAVALENARLLEAERQLRDLAIVEERNRMAVEIHDTLAQGFMGVIMQLQAAKAARAADAGQEHLAQAEALARESLQEARRSVWNLRPLALESAGLAGALRTAAAQFEQRTGIAAAVAVSGDAARLTAAHEAGLLRIAQEALHNVQKHAQAASVEIALSIADDTATLTIADNGIGFDPARSQLPGAGAGVGAGAGAGVGAGLGAGAGASPGAGAGTAAAAGPGAGAGGFGLAGMADRARGLGGTLVIDAAPGAGCRIVATVPVGGGGLGGGDTAVSGGSGGGNPPRIGDSIGGGANG